MSTVETQTQKTIRTVSGRVISNKMDKTIVIMTERKVQHALYGKFVKKSTKIHAHDENNICSEGDLVTIKQTRPVSKKKTWVLVDVVEKVK